MHCFLYKNHNISVFCRINICQLSSLEMVKWNVKKFKEIIENQNYTYSLFYRCIQTEGLSFLATSSQFLKYYFTDDISYNKVITQSKTYDNRQDYDPKNAVDRNYSTCTRAPPIGLNSPEKSMWWKVDLGRVYTIYSITIMFKNYDLKDGLYLKTKYSYFYYNFFSEMKKLNKSNGKLYLSIKF